MFHSLLNFSIEKYFSFVLNKNPDARPMQPKKEVRWTWQIHFGFTLITMKMCNLCFSSLVKLKITHKFVISCTKRQGSHLKCCFVGKKDNKLLKSKLLGSNKLNHECPKNSWNAIEFFIFLNPVWKTMAVVNEH